MKERSKIQKQLLKLEKEPPPPIKKVLKTGRRKMTHASLSVTRFLDSMAHGLSSHLHRAFLHSPLDVPIYLQCYLFVDAPILVPSHLSRQV